MSKINSRTVASAAVILSLGCIAERTAVAHEGRTHMTPRAAAHRHVARELGHAGYAQLTSGQGRLDEACDLPTSGCSNDERISN